MTIWRMRITCWITKAEHIHSHYVIFIAFPLQKLLQERASVLHYMYVHCLSCFKLKRSGVPRQILRDTGIEFDVFSTVHHSIDLFHLPILMHNSFIH